MKIGIPREIKVAEERVAMTPAGAGQLVQAGHSVLVEKNAGHGAGFSDTDYREAGAELVEHPSEAWQADLVVKVKEPLAEEFAFLRGQMLFTYLHLAGVTSTLTDTLLASKTLAIAYETVENAAGQLPLLAPMSAVAGSMAVTMGNYHLARHNGGRGMLLSELFDRRFGKVLVVGDGVVGQHSAKVAHNLGASVVIAGHNPSKTRLLESALNTRLRFIESNQSNIEVELEDIDLLVGAVLVRGARAPAVISENMVKTMPRGSVIVDVSIDQGGCVATSRPTTHTDPVYEKHGVIHYCVANMPGAYPRLSTLALTEATLPYVIKLAEEGVSALRDDAGFAMGVNTAEGHITCQAVADSLGRAADFRAFT